MGKTINHLTPLTDTQANDSGRLSPSADPVSGEASSVTMAQQKLVIGTQKLKYVATGLEGTTLTLSPLAQKDLISIAREGQTMYEVVATPDPVEYIWDGTIITFGLAPRAGERFLILYRNN